MTHLYANNAAGTLSAGITNASTTLTLNAGQGALFPNPGAGQDFYATLTDAATQSLIEIVLVTARGGDVFTITRAQDGTSALSWNAGDILSQRVVAAELRAFSTTATGNLLNVQVFSASGTYTPTAGASSAIVKAIGGGGAGGGAPSTIGGTASLGLGGSAGAYAEIYISAGNLSTQTVTIGAGGIPVSGGAGGNGGQTSFGSLIVCPGGSGGITAGPSATFAVSNLPAPSIPSGTGTFIVKANGQAATGLAIALSASANQVASGPGANSQWGTCGFGVSGQGNGTAAVKFGSGGGGGASTNGGGAQSGGVGAPGYVIVEEYT